MTSMRKWISALMIAAFVMSTTMPSYSHAMVNDHASKAVASEHADCHGHGKTAAQKNEAQHEKDGTSCCKKGLCKCANGSCHAGVKLLDNSTAALSTPLSHEASFDFAEQRLTSAFLEGIKRPPRT